MLCIFIIAAILLLDIMVMVFAVHAAVAANSEGAFFRILYKNHRYLIINPIRKVDRKDYPLGEI